MKKRILKYPVHAVQATEMPLDAEIVKFDFQNSTPTVWAVTVDSEKCGLRKLRVVATGQAVPLRWKYIDTAFDGPFVWHLYLEPWD